MPTPNLRTKTARTKLKAKRRPYYAPVRRGVSLGYRRKAGAAGGWCARVYVGADATQGKTYKYAEHDIGLADDVEAADGLEVFDYGQAQEAALAFARRKHAELERGGGITVKDALDAYMDWYRSEGKKAEKTTQYTIDSHILPEFGDVRISELESPMIRKWQQKLVTAPLRKRGGAKVKIDAKDPEVLRKRRATANRILTVLKAGLNYAFKNGYLHKGQTDLAWRAVSPFKDVDPKDDIRWLTVEESRRLINACDPDFRLLVRAALLTGARYGELRALKVGDYKPDSGEVRILVSKTGRKRSVPLAEEGQNFFEEQTAGRKASELIFTDADGDEWGRADQYRPMKAAVKKAKLEDVTFHTLRHTYASLQVSEGTSLKVIAKVLGHTSTRVTEKHYADVADDYVKQTIRANMPTFVEEKPKVQRLKKK